MRLMRTHLSALTANLNRIFGGSDMGRSYPGAAAPSSSPPWFEQAQSHIWQLAQSKAVVMQAQPKEVVVDDGLDMIADMFRAIVKNGIDDKTKVEDIAEIGLSLVEMLRTRDRTMRALLDAAQPNGPFTLGGASRGGLLGHGAATPTGVFGNSIP